MSALVEVTKAVLVIVMLAASSFYLYQLVHDYRHSQASDSQPQTSAIQHPSNAVVPPTAPSVPLKKRPLGHVEPKNRTAKVDVAESDPGNLHMRVALAEENVSELNDNLIDVETKLRLTLANCQQRLYHLEYVSRLPQGLTPAMQPDQVSLIFTHQRPSGLEATTLAPLIADLKQQGLQRLFVAINGHMLPFDQNVNFQTQSSASPEQWQPAELGGVPDNKSRHLIWVVGDEVAAPLANLGDQRLKDDLAQRWQGYAVDVVYLVDSQRNAGPDNFAGWQNFASRHGGLVILLPYKKERPPNQDYASFEVQSRRIICNAILRLASLPVRNDANPRPQAAKKTQLPAIPPDSGNTQPKDGTASTVPVPFPAVPKKRSPRGTADAGPRAE